MNESQAAVPQTQVNPHEHDRFVLRQIIRPMVNRYEFSLPEHEDEPFCFVQQKRFKFKEDIRFYTDSSKTQELMRIKARQAFDPRARYDVVAADGSKVGELQKVFGKSLLRSTYALYGTSGVEVIAREMSMPIAIFRRLVGFIPYVESVADWLPIPYDFEFVLGETRIGEHRRRRWKLRDVYEIDVSADTARVLDRRLVLALAVGMDALQAR